MFFSFKIYSAILCVLAFKFCVFLFQPLLPAVLIDDVSTSVRSPNDVSTSARSPNDISASVRSPNYISASVRNAGMQS